MLEARYAWHETMPELSEEFLEAFKRYNLSDPLAPLIWERGITTPEALETYLKPSLDQLHDPYLLHDMDKAVARLQEAIEQGQRILIYGDYDADGMTATAIMQSALEELGAEVMTYLPDRVEDGYGPNLSTYKYFIDNEAIDLIVTVDNGVAGLEAIAYAQAQGVDVVVTDHHALPPELPNAYAIVHPMHPDGDYPFSELAGCGVAFKVATALLGYLPAESLDLVAIGTIADMMALTDENRVLVKFGLEKLRHTERIGLEKLYEIAKIDPATINEETVGFQIAPRLNALGRVSDPNPAVELLNSFDEDLVFEIALMIDQKNEERKVVVDQITKQALENASADPVQIIVGPQSWNPGILGIVAGRLLEQTGKPTIVLAEIGNGEVKGSARSTDSFNMFEAIGGVRDLMTAFGGHAQAAGMTFPLENLPKIQAHLNAVALESGDGGPSKNTYEIDESLKLESITIKMIQELEALAPFGMQNPKPKFHLSDVQVKTAQAIGANKATLKVRLMQDDSELDAIAFNMGQFLTEVQQGQNLEFVGTVGINTWNDKSNPQFMIDDIAPQGIQLYDVRQGQAVPNDLTIYTKNGVENAIMSSGLLVQDTPESLDGLHDLLAENTFSAIYFMNRIPMNQEYYLTGFGSRDEYAKLYRTLSTYRQFNIRQKLNGLADYLNIPRPLLVKMIQIFQELDFITIDDNGNLEMRKNPPKRAFSESRIYQDLEAQVATQTLFAKESVQTIYDRLTTPLQKEEH
jgi:single-stranded-DNA-specific exonuclease